MVVAASCANYMDSWPRYELLFRTTAYLGIPAVVYLTLNQTIRKELKKRVAKIKLFGNSSINPIVM